MKKLVNDCILLSAFALSVTTVCFADTESDIRYRARQCEQVCEHEIRLRQDRFPCYEQCKKQMEKELKTAIQEIVPQYVERPGDCPITPKKDVEEILGIKIQKVIVDNKRWMTCDFVSEDIIVRITDSVGAPMISGRDPHTERSKSMDDNSVSKLSAAAKRQINIWENHRGKSMGKVRI